MLAVGVGGVAGGLGLADEVVHEVFGLDALLDVDRGGWGVELVVLGVFAAPHELWVEVAIAAGELR